MNAAASSGRSIKRIACVQLCGEFPDFCSRLMMLDYGLPLIATVLAKAGYSVAAFVEHVHPPVWDVIARSNLVCMSTLSAGADKTYRLADKIRTQLGIPVILGGTHATYYYKDVLEHCDYVVFGEGDETILDLVDALRSGRDPASVAGIAYRTNGAIRRTATRPGPIDFDTIPDFGLVHGYRKLSGLDIIRYNKLPFITAQASRGCHFQCTYCIVDKMFPGRYRKRNIEAVIQDLKAKRQYGRNLLFVDNEFAGDPQLTKKLLNRIIEEELDYDIMVLTRTDVANKEDLLAMMRLAGVTRIYQGFESISPATLKGYHKRQTLECMRASIKKLHAYGFRISGSFVLGADTDTLESVRATADFVLDNGIVTSYFFPLWGHYVEEKMNGTAIVPRHRAIFKDWGHCDGNFVTHFPANMPPSVLQRALMEAHQSVFSWRAIWDKARQKKLVDARVRLHHRLWWSDIYPGLEQYVSWLEEVEHGLYDSNGRLMEDRLWARYQQNPEWRWNIDDGRPETPYVSPLEHTVPGKNNIRCVPAETAVGH